MLNEFFTSCFHLCDEPLSQADRQDHQTQNLDCLTELLCTEEEVYAIIQSLDATKANGPDGISIRMLKGTAMAIRPSLTMLFNISIRAAHFPSCWKQSSIVPIPKASKLNSPVNYRPISLLSPVSKILERHVHYVISSHLEDTHSLSNLQLGFQQGRSAFTSLLSIVLFSLT